MWHPLLVVVWGVTIKMTMIMIMLPGALDVLLLHILYLARIIIIQSYYYEDYKQPIS